MIIHFDQRNLLFFAIILYTGPVVLNQTGATAGRLPEFAPMSIVVISGALKVAGWLQPPVSRPEKPEAARSDA
jgi:hypothetical protein